MSLGSNNNKSTTRAIKKGRDQARNKLNRIDHPKKDFNLCLTFIFLPDYLF